MAFFNWRRVIRLPKKFYALISGQVDSYKSYLSEMKADLAYAQSLPEGHGIFVKDDAAPGGAVYVPRDDYVVELQAKIAEAEAHIAELEA